MSVQGKFKREGQEPPPPPPPPPPPDNGGLPEIIIDAIEIGSLSSISTQPATLSNLAYSNHVATSNTSSQNAVSSQQAINELNVAVAAASVNTVKNIGPMEARSAVDVLTNNELASEITALRATVSAFAETPQDTPGDHGTGNAIYFNLPATFVFSHADADRVEMIVPFKKSPQK